MSHTPGPWYPYLAVDDGEKPGIDHDRGTVILYGCKWDDCGIRGETHEERIANAHLIAAAPELLEALEYIRQNCFIYCDSSMDIDNTANQMADAAIKKARGS